MSAVDWIIIIIFQGHLSVMWCRWTKPLGMSTGMANVLEKYIKSLAYTNIYKVIWSAWCNLRWIQNITLKLAEIKYNSFNYWSSWTHLNFFKFTLEPSRPAVFAIFLQYGRKDLSLQFHCSNQIFLTLFFTFFFHSVTVPM